MAEKMKTMDQKIKENIKNYNLNNLLLPEELQVKLDNLSALTGAGFYVTDRHGAKFISSGGFDEYEADVVNKPGEKIRVVDRTVGHIYVNYENVSEEKRDLVEQAVKQEAFWFSAYVEELYLHREYALHSDILEERLESETYYIKDVEKEDPLTGVYNLAYFTNRMRVIDRSEIVPVALIQANINDSTFVKKHFGEEECDRLISTVATFLKEEAKTEYTIGRWENDVFIIVITVPEEGEAQEYCKRVQKRCLDFEDEVLAPSVAFGIVNKQNVEESLGELISDAEYSMFENKLDMKQKSGYEERLKKGLK